ncbi:MAG: hypothetical protein GC154_12445 [bacterium]|nr:hypothetical protein [bacterium]
MHGANARSKRLAIWLAAAYLIFMTPMLGRKYGYTVDATPSFNLTRAIVSQGLLFPYISPEQRVKQGYVYSIAFIPFYLAGGVIQPLFGEPLDWVQRKMMCWMNVVFAALTVGLMSRWLYQMGYSVRAQWALPLLYGLTTLAFNYARYDYNKTMAGFLLFAAFYYFTRYTLAPSGRLALVSGVFTGLLIALRAELGAAAPIFALGIFFIATKSARGLKDAAYYCAPAACAAAFFLLYNRFYWSGGVSGGYEGSFAANPLPALLGFIGSPGKSLFLFNPALLLLPLCVRAFMQRNGAVAGTWAAASLAAFALYAFWGNWWGGWGYGPRHLVPLIPLLCLPLADAIERRERALDAALIALGAAGLAVQALGALFDFNDVILYLTNQGVTEQQIIWNSNASQIGYHAILLGSIPPARWDLGWAWLAGRSSGLFIVLFFAWSAALAGCGYAIIQQIRKPSESLEEAP